MDRRSLVPALAVVLLAGTIAAAQDAASLKNPTAPTAESVAAGKAIYLRKCANCHATNGRGSPGNDLTPPAPTLVGNLLHGSSDGEIFNTIKNGVAPEFNMAAWGQGEGDNHLSDAEIWNVVNYVKTLRMAAP
jgi:cytochrome c oxidase cbb3-type subunit 3